MKIQNLLLLHIIHLACVANGIGREKEAAETKLPGDALRLKQTYQQATERALQPLRERYASDLKRLLDSYTRSGKLAEAVAIKSELDRIATAPASESVAGFERRLLGTKWNWADAFSFEFTPGGKATRGGFTWKAVKPLVVEYAYPNGPIGTITFESDLSGGVISETQKDGKKIQMSLTRLSE
jgi:hypothetical protein